MLLFFCLICILPLLCAQNREVKGQVSDSEGLPVIGATIKAVGGATATITDMDGRFSLIVDTKVRFLEFSFVGMKTERLEIKTGFIKVTMRENVQMLEETVVVGYTTARRSDFTGSIASVDNERINSIPTTSVASALAGQMAGVNVLTTEGSPDAEVQIRIRGGGSITQDNSPLFVVDGFPVNSIDDIPSSEIQSIDVLKDASSTAIYGARGANGVILVTTKRGKSGREISFNSYVGFSKVYNMYEMMSPYEFAYYQRELGVGDNVFGLWEDMNIWRSVKGRDWQDELYGNTGLKQNYNLNISGGADNLRYTLGYTRDDEKYIMRNSNYLRDNLNLRLNHDITKKLTVNGQIRFTNTTITGPNISYNKMLRNTVKYAPVTGLGGIEEDDQLGDDEGTTDYETLGSLYDPIYNVLNEYKEQKRLSIGFNGGVSWEIINGLKYEFKGSYSLSRDYTDNVWIRGTGQSSTNGGMPVAQHNEYKGYGWTIQNLLSYRKKMKNQQLDVLLGQEMNSRATNEIILYSKFYPAQFTAKDVLSHWDYGTASPTYMLYGEPSRTASYFGRVDYSYKNTYYGTFNLRADGTNVFHPKNRWGIFPGGSFAWRISNEQFMKPIQKWLSDLKLRISYGAAGNARVASNWRQTYSTVTDARYQYYINNSTTSAVKPGNRLKNENLTWETKYSANMGLDAAFLNNRLRMTVDFYNDVTKDLILQIDLPHNSGYRYQYINVGQTTNRGMEISLDGTIIDNKKLYVGANFNIAFNQNRVDKLDGNPEMIASSAWGVEVGSDDYRVKVNDEMGLMYGYVVDGFYTENDFTWNASTKKWDLKPGVIDCSSVFTRSGDSFGPGHIKLKKICGKGTLINEEEDRTVIGRALPKFTGGFGFKASYVGFDFSAMFNFSYGNDVYNANKIDNTSYSGSKKYNNLSSIMNVDKRWSPIDPETGLNIMYGNNADPERFIEINKNKSIWSPMAANTTIFTDWAIEDGSFLRLSNVTLGYSLPKHIISKVALKKLRFYVTGNNVFCLTKYSGQDPEVNTRKSSPLTPGCDYSAYPKARSVVFGINATF